MADFNQYCNKLLTYIYTRDGIKWKLLRYEKTLIETHVKSLLHILYRNIENINSQTYNKGYFTLKVKTTASFLELTSFTTIDVENIFKDYFQTYLNLNYTYSNLNITSEYISCDVYIPK